MTRNTISVLLVDYDNQHLEPHEIMGLAEVRYELVYIIGRMPPSMPPQSNITVLTAPPGKNSADFMLVAMGGYVAGQMAAEMQASFDVLSHDKGFHNFASVMRAIGVNTRVIGIESLPGDIHREPRPESPASKDREMFPKERDALIRIYARRKLGVTLPTNRRALRNDILNVMGWLGRRAPQDAGWKASVMAEHIFEHGLPEIFPRRNARGRNSRKVRNQKRVNRLTAIDPPV